jgi:hypothetical protein
MSSNATKAFWFEPIKSWYGICTLMASMPTDDARMYQSCNLLIPAGTLVSQKVVEVCLAHIFRHIFIICLSWDLYLCGHCFSLFVDSSCSAKSIVCDMRSHAIPLKNRVVPAVVALLFFFSNVDTNFGIGNLDFFDGRGSLDGCGEGGSFAGGVDSGSPRG